MKILRRDRSGDLKQANSPYRTERFIYWACRWIRHPRDITWFLLRYIRLELDDNSSMHALPTYGNAADNVYSGAQLDAGHIHGSADALRRLGNILLERANHVESMQEILARGDWPTQEQWWPEIDGGEEQ